MLLYSLSFESSLQSLPFFGLNCLFRGKFVGNEEQVLVNLWPRAINLVGRLLLSPVDTLGGLSLAPCLDGDADRPLKLLVELDIKYISDFAVDDV